MNDFDLSYKEPLKPCPFCGAKEPKVKLCGAKPVCHVACNNCDASGPIRSTNRKASEGWNRRPVY